jgi:hypothetical protein
MAESGNAYDPVERAQWLRTRAREFYVSALETTDAIDRAELLRLVVLYREQAEMIECGYSGHLIWLNSTSRL